MAQLIAEDKTRLEKLAGKRAAVAEARESGISMRDTDAILSISTQKRLDPRVAAAKIAVAEGRLSGTSLAALDGILARATGIQVAA